VKNNEDFIVQKVGETISMESQTKNIFTGIIHFKKITVQFDDFQSYFGLGYAITVTRSIGSTFDEPISIYEWNHFFMDRNNIYTAMAHHKS
jgi:ATP-dependent exoDNAse (exonuclease V) alpha subunit